MKDLRSAIEEKEQLIKRLHNEIEVLRAAERLLLESEGTAATGPVAMPTPIVAAMTRTTTASVSAPSATRMPEMNAAPDAGEVRKQFL
jgi:hypothetical protein